MRITHPLPIVIGLSLILLTGVADATSTTCNTSTSCAAYINSSSGVAIHGEANTGIGVRGTSNTSTGFYGASRSGSPLFPGVEGESLDQTGDDVAGAFGLTAQSGGTAPAYGVLAYGSSYGVYGDSTGAGNGSSDAPTSFGVAGVESGGVAGRDTDVGVFGQSTHGTAVLALANVASSNSTAYMDATGSPAAIVAEAEPDQTNGGAVAVEAVSKSTALEACNTSTNGGCVYIGTPSYSIDAPSFTVDNKGNVVATSLMTNYGSYVRTTGTTGTARTTYSARTAAPALEDSGEGQLVSGRGYVKLDPALSDVIDNRTAYRVFLTPEGDSNGVYVAQKTPAGFVVRESGGGHSTISFDYRIVAKPLHDDAQRLALAPPEDRSRGRRQFRSRQPGIAQQPADPFARLRSHLGAAAYARELEIARKLETAR